MLQRILASFGFIVGIAWLVSPARGMVVVKRDFPDLVARAEQIVVGTVTSIAETRSNTGTPQTLVTLSDLTVLKGSVGDTLTLQLYGGRDGDRAVRIADMPEFHVGDRELLFVAGNGQAVAPLVGVWQGRFHVRFDATRGADVVESGDGKPILGRVRRDLQFGSAAADAGLTLDEFRQLIADELAHPTGPAVPTP